MVVIAASKAVPACLLPSSMDRLYEEHLDIPREKREQLRGDQITVVLGLPVAFGAGKVTSRLVTPLFRPATTISAEAFALRQAVVTNVVASKEARFTSGYRGFDTSLTSIDATQATAAHYADRLNRYIDLNLLSTIPSKSTAIVTSYAERFERISVNRQFYDVEFTSMRHSDGMSSLFIRKVSPHTDKPLTRASFEKVFDKTNESLAHVAKVEMKAPAVMIQWDPGAVANSAHLLETTAKRTRHYVGNRSAVETLSPLGHLERFAKKAVGVKEAYPRGLLETFDPSRVPQSYITEVITTSTGKTITIAPDGSTLSRAGEVRAALRSLVTEERDVPTLFFGLNG
jgi:hypothetical protein